MSLNYELVWRTDH